MEAIAAVRKLSALAQDARLTVFRLLIQAGPEGMAAGEIARASQSAPNTTSAQLLVLANAGLIRSRREGRSIVYSADFEAVSDLLIFLTQDCCAGRQEICEPLAVIAVKCCKSKGTRHETSARSRRRR